MTRRYESSEKNSPYRRGVVTKVDPAKGRVRVEFADEDENTSMWMTVNQPATAANKSYGMPDVGAQVNCLVDWDGEGGTVIGAVWSEKDMPPTADGDTTHIRTEAGTDIVVNKKTGAISITGAASLVIEAGSVTIKGPVDIEGDHVRHNGHDIGDDHKHTGVMSGPTLTGPPE